MQHALIPPVIPIEGTGHSLHRIHPARAQTVAELISQARSDEDICREFPEVIKDYAGDIQNVWYQLRAKYSVAPLRRFGYLVMHNETENAVGMAVVGAGDERMVFTPSADIVPVRAICFSAWLLKCSRGEGIFTSVGDQLNNIGRELALIDHPDTTRWSGGTIYTEIREGNERSERYAAGMGYEPVGIALHDSAYRAWVQPEDWQAVLSRSNASN